VTPPASRSAASQLSAAVFELPLVEYSPHRVLPIGGLKEKLLAALRGGIKTVLIPKDNEKDLAEIPDNVKDGMTIIPVTTADEVIRHALIKTPIAIEWTEPVEPVKPADNKEDGSGVIAH
jgi:ATP-dependent Lon protease